MHPDDYGIGYDDDEFSEMYSEPEPITVELYYVELIYGDGFVLIREYSETFVI